MRLLPFFSYYGAKQRIGGKYPKPRWYTIIEPFAGSASYSHWYPNRKVILYDINPKVCATWQYLIRVTEEEVMSLPLVFDDVRELNICQEAKYLIGWWLSSANAAPRHKPTTWLKTGMWPNQFWGEYRRSIIAAQLRHIRHWKIHNQGYDYCPDILATWFIDPPYQNGGKFYPYHDVSYVYLNRWTRTRKGQVIACGEEGDNWLPFLPFITAQSLNKTGTKGWSKEVMWTNDKP